MGEACRFVTRLSARGFRARILLGAVLVVALAWVLVLVTVGVAFSAVDPPVRPHNDDTYAACLTDPDRWRDIRVGPNRIRTGSRASAVGADPDLEVGRARLMERGPRRAVARRHALSGPCAWSAVEFRGSKPGFSRRNVLPMGLSLGVFLAVLAVGLASNSFTVVPLLRRIDRLHQAALRVGGEDYRSENDQVGDALSEIAEILDASHTRIVTDREALVERHEALERYLAELAHDLRIPLSSLLLALREVQKALPVTSDPSPAQRALQDANYVSSLIENLHQATRLQNGLDATKGEVDLRDVVRRLEVRFTAVGKLEGVEVAAAVPDVAVPIRCNPALAERAIGNLIQNAVTHGGSHTAVILTMLEGQFELVVIDDGAGLPKSDRVDLTHRTLATDAARPRNPGLGIAITNEIARRAGWRVSYEAAEGGGLRVRLTGPLVPRGDQSTPAL